MAFRKDPKTGRKVAVGAVVAGIGGFVAGILTAPKSGKETRAELAEQASAVKNDAEIELAVAQRELGIVIKDAQAKTANLGAKAKEELNEALIRAKDAQSKAVIVMKAFKAGQAEDPELNKAVKQAKQAQKNLGKFLKS
jgi:gas vesicle protein